MSADLHELLAVADRLLGRGNRAAPPFIGVLERPSPSERRATGALALQGWLFNRGSAIASLHARCDGDDHAIDYGSARPDVAAAFPGEARAALSGFAATIPLGGKPGARRIEIWARLRSGERHLAFARTVVVPGASTPLVTRLRDGVGRLVQRALAPRPPVAAPNSPHFPSPSAPPRSATGSNGTTTQARASTAAPTVARVATTSSTVERVATSAATAEHVALVAAMTERVASSAATAALGASSAATAALGASSAATAALGASSAATAARVAAIDFLVAQLRPRNLVELDAGDERHFQWLVGAVAAAGLASRSYAIGAALAPGVPFTYERRGQGWSARIAGSSDGAIRHFTDGTIELLVLRARDRPLRDELLRWEPKLHRRALILVPDLATSAAAQTFWRSDGERFPRLALERANLGLLFHGPLAAASLAPFGGAGFPTVERPRVSIVIPVFGQLALTGACLAQLLAHHSELPLEVIVVDDASLDATPNFLSHLPGLRVVTLDENRGYPDACNRGAAAARGDFLVFLNNDTRVTARWLDELHATFAQHPDAGLVGAKLVHLDGKLQEAGCAIWSDGSAMNVGRGDDPERPEYNFLRDVDYCSGAAIMLRRDLFQRLGGLDPIYAPGYYEDGDLAFKVRAEGLRVLYQPLARVLHHEGGTTGTDLTRGVKRFQLINQEKFLRRWGHALADFGPRPSDERRPYDRTGGERILVVDHVTPRRDQDSGSARMFQLIALFVARGMKVTFVADNLERVAPHTDALQRLGVEVLYQPYLASVEEHLARAGARYDLVLLSKRDPAAKHIDAVRRCAPRAFLIFDTVDLHFVREAREAELKRDRALARAARSGKARELDLIRRADCTLVVSAVERDLLRREVGERPIEVLGNIHTVAESPAPFGARRDLLFVGFFTHAPNADAMLHFIRDIFPSVRRRLPGVVLRVVGKDPPPELRALASDDVLVLGQVADLDPLLASSRVMVAPLRFGAGVKGKVSQSLACGLPVVATPVAAEGMGLTDGENVLVAKRASDFAAAVARLYGDERLWQRLSTAGLTHARAHFSAATVAKPIDRLLELAREARAPRVAEGGE